MEKQAERAPPYAGLPTAPGLGLFQVPLRVSRLTKALAPFRFAVFWLKTPKESVTIEPMSVLTKMWLCRPLPPNIALAFIE